MPDKYSYCPDCGRKTVYWSPRIRMEDNYACRMTGCLFYFFTVSGSPSDEANEKRWRDVNAQRGHVVEEP
jgi:hypothetical protein